MWAKLAVMIREWKKERWARALWREKRAMDYQDYLATVKETVKEVIEEGRKEGREEALRKTAENLKAMGLSVEQITAATGLAPKEVKRA
jgi:predicted transposase/invertase (TIGR01784 family)